MDGPPGSRLEDVPEPPRLRQLRWMVNALMLALIVGIGIIATALVIRLNGMSARPLPVLPEQVSLPAGETARAVTFGEGWIAVVTADAAGTERIRILNAATGTERASLTIPPGD